MSENESITIQPTIQYQIKTQETKKAHRPEIEMWENLKENFSKTTFNDLHADNNQNSI